ncbi:DUF3899 domain-containing protein [Haloarchaeobius amylolyticus]|uniref:DUF3899 domain-containing protein n=1 Tax=Haloarchaeobius amylolyticus TaxID=1198296 RepID=A0ABD6BJT6_9EURY
MPEQTDKRSESNHRWLVYTMFCGILFIAISIILQIIEYPYSISTSTSNGIGYIGVFLFLSSFLVQITLE